VGGRAGLKREQPGSAVKRKDAEKSLTFYTGFYWQLCMLYTQAPKKIMQEAVLSV